MELSSWNITRCSRKDLCNYESILALSILGSLINLTQLLELVERILLPYLVMAWSDSWWNSSHLWLDLFFGFHNAICVIQRLQGSVFFVCWCQQIRMCPQEEQLQFSLWDLLHLFAFDTLEPMQNTIALCRTFWDCWAFDKFHESLSQWSLIGIEGGLRLLAKYVFV